MMWLLVRAKDNANVDVYTVHEPPQPPLDRIDRAASLVFVRDGFSWGAALFSPVYLAVTGQWLAFVSYLAIVAAASGVLWSLGLLMTWLPFLILGLNLYLGFEVSTLQRMWLNARGWTELGTVSGRNLPECERRFIETWLSTAPAGFATPVSEAEPGFWGASWRRLVPGRA